MEPTIRRPALVRHARYRWDRVREQHQLVFPEGLMVLNETGAAIVQLCDGRPAEELLGVLKKWFVDGYPEAEVFEFLAKLTQKGLLHDAADLSSGAEGATIS